jgi:hypothetical protein
MKIFRLLARGDDFVVVMDGASSLMGFYVPIFVSASDEGTAVRLAREAVEKRLREKTVELTDTSRITFEDVKQLESAEGVPSVSPGFSWFPVVLQNSPKEGS